MSVSQIIRSNVFTYFNLIFAVIAALLIAVGAFKGLTFLPVIIANMLIGIAQQIYAKRILDKLSLLDVTDYTAPRDGREEKISSGISCRTMWFFLRAGSRSRRTASSLPVGSRSMNLS